MKNITHKKAFVSLFAVVLSVIILSIAVGMSSLAFKQIVIGVTSDQSNDAFYIADSALQCAIMLDSQDYFPNGIYQDVNCGSAQAITLEPLGPGVTVFAEPGGFNWMGGCAQVVVTKDNLQTKIEAYGYNVDCPDVHVEDMKVVQRALRVRYSN